MTTLQPAGRTDEDPGRVAVLGLTKSFGDVHAVSDLTFAVEPGSVTGFLGPNGAGKTTTLRMLLGLVTPTSGTATIGGRTYAEIPRPMTVVGAALEAASFHPGRTARDHLRVYAAASGIPAGRVDAVLDQVGLSADGRRRTKGYSMGMRQRLGLATALLGEPRVLLLDEPTNGLDPEGILWLRGFLRHLATERGCTVLVSSHLLAEMQQTVDRVVIVSRGRLVRQGALDELSGDEHVVLRTATAAGSSTLAEAVRGAGGSASPVPDDPRALRVAGLSAAQVGHLAFAAAVELHELHAERSDLEQTFLRLTSDAGVGTGPPRPRDDQVEVPA